MRLNSNSSNASCFPNLMCPPPLHTAASCLVMTPETSTHLVFNVRDEAGLRALGIRHRPPACLAVGLTAPPATDDELELLPLHGRGMRKAWQHDSEAEAIINAAHRPIFTKEGKRWSVLGVADTNRGTGASCCLQPGSC